MSSVSSYANFFMGSTGVAGALTGLLFVSVSIAPERFTGPSASVERQAIATTAFTALVDSLWISLFALRPGNNIPTASLILGAIGVLSTGGLLIRLWRARPTQRLTNRWPVEMLAITVLYGYQASTAFTARTSQAAQSIAATLVLVFFAVGLIRAWELLGLRGGGVLSMLAERAHRNADGGGGAPAGPGEAPGSGPTPGQ